MKALDLFAGTGWGVACKALGIEEEGVELMPEAVATRTANGMTTILRDVWDSILGAPRGDYELLIASPPCQTFSMAGNGAGRRALADVLHLVERRVYERPEALREATAGLDPRTALVLVPLAHVERDRPTYVAFEQVPSVLPVWEACADVMRELGYSVATGVVGVESFGVSQTRKRAILVARADGKEARLPAPTHSRYFSHAPAELDPETARWASMAETIGWGFTDRPAPTFCNSGHGGAGIEWGGNSIRKAMRSASLSGEGWIAKPGAEPGTNDAIRVTPAEAAALQSYPADFDWQGSKTKQYLQIGNAVPPLFAEAVLRELTS
ncbi:DNA methylase [Arthrobacter phage Crewmate]|uniref:DNA (cytosine-5-)-methyltransferase n=1 Tax=Arthrobacter phage Crewmate TaxID=2832317 RepID=A0AA48Y3P0_9CAUD|nr:DNA methylase [Arthrobacter phage Crewmate]UIW13304.1 DNA methylase [Arthrobacter phage Crewmate]